MNLFNSIRRKTGEGLTLLRQGLYFQFFSQACANCIPANMVVLGKSYLMERENDGERRKEPYGKYQTRQASPEELTAIMESSDDHSGMADIELFEKFFQAGYACYLIEEGEAILGYTWVFPDSYSITVGRPGRGEIAMRLPRGTVFLGNVFIHHRYRRQRLYSRLLDSIEVDQTRLRGIHRLLVTVKASNDVSIKAHRKNGFEITSTIYHISICSFTFVVAFPDAGRPRCIRASSGRSIPYELLAGRANPKT